jgi:hypothetical protein
MKLLSCFKLVVSVFIFHEGLFANTLQLPVASCAANRNLGFLARHRHWWRMRATAGVVGEDVAVFASCCLAPTMATR